MCTFSIVFPQEPLDTAAQSSAETAPDATSPPSKSIDELVAALGEDGPAAAGDAALTRHGRSDVLERPGPHSRELPPGHADVDLVAFPRLQSNEAGRGVSGHQHRSEVSLKGAIGWWRHPAVRAPALGSVR